MHTSNVQIDTNNSHDIFCIIRALDTGIANHELWYREVHQSLVCKTRHMSPADLGENAHHCCKFGKWLYSSDTEALKPLDTFHAVIDSHEKMHALARKILLKIENNKDIADIEYGDFTSQAIDFKLNVRELQHTLMSQVCVVDHLTGAWNRHLMYSKLHQEKERLVRTGHSCAICMMDLDHFKRVNDNYGHLVGDQVLKMVTDFCRNSLREYDSIYRYGGEEFLFCLPNAEQDESKTIIERLCISLGEHPILLPSGESISVTASFGIACLQKSTSIEDSIQAADHALLCAKTKGRNRVCFWDDGLKEFE